MQKNYRTLKKIVMKEGGKIVEISHHRKMQKLQIEFGGAVMGYNFSVSKHCNLDTLVRGQIRKLKKRAR